MVPWNKYTGKDTSPPHWQWWDDDETPFTSTTSQNTHLHSLLLFHPLVQLPSVSKNRQSVHSIILVQPTQYPVHFHHHHCQCHHYHRQYRNFPLQTPAALKLPYHDSLSSPDWEILLHSLQNNNNTVSRFFRQDFGLAQRVIQPSINLDNKRE